MSRRKAAPKRQILPDPLFNSELLAKFINTVMKSGKKSVSERIVYGALDNVVKQLQKNPKILQQEEGEGGDGRGGRSLKPVAGEIAENAEVREFAIAVFRNALDNVMPTVEVKSRRVGGSTYQVPVEIRPARRRALGMRWLAEYASERNEKTMVLRLASEIIDAMQGRGGAIKKREDVHRMAKANQAFAHYRW